MWIAVLTLHVQEKSKLGQQKKKEKNLNEKTKITPTNLKVLNMKYICVAQ